MKIFGRRLKAARELAGYPSAQSFAKRIGHPPHRYRAWERGDCPPDMPTLLELCRALKVTPNDLLPYKRTAADVPGSQ